MDIQQLHQEFLEKIKTEICKDLISLYTKKYKTLPNWEEEEEIVIDESILGNITIPVEVGNTYDESTNFESWVINEYVVTLDLNLFFRCNDDYNEFNWTELSTDSLVGICKLIKKKL